MKFTKKSERLAHIGERDNWICGICKSKIDQSLFIYESDWAATIDHVFPRCKGGSNEDENLQIAHWKCNKEKGQSTSEKINKTSKARPRSESDWKAWRLRNKKKGFKS